MRRYLQFLFIIVTATTAFVTAASAKPGDPCNAAFTDSHGNLRKDKVAAYTMHTLYEVYRKADKDCDGKISKDEISTFENGLEVTAQIDGAQRYYARVLRSGETVPLDKNGEPHAPIVGPLEAPPLDESCAAGWKLFLRGASEEIRTFDCPKDFKSASGAQFGFSRDGAAGNTSWSMKGIATLSYIWRSEEKNKDKGTYLAGYSFGPMASFNRLTNSLQSLKSKEIDVLSYGGMGEIVVGRFLGGTHALRGRAQINSDFEGTEKSWSGIAEWQPVYSRAFISSPFPITSQFMGQVDPMLRVVYSSRRNGSLDPIFTDRDEAVRLGPVVALRFYPTQSNFLIPKWLQDASVTGTLSWLEDAHTHQIYRYYTSAFNLPLDPSGHLGLQLSYQYGAVEATGQKVNSITAGLGAKW